MQLKMTHLMNKNKLNRSNKEQLLQTCYQKYMNNNI